MCSMMFGSLVYKTVSTSSNPLPAQRILTGVLVLASVCLFVPGHVRDERITLWCFCVFELCCGAYYPVMASLKGKLVDDGLRASVYGMLRIPLNVFVVLALSTTKEGESIRYPAPQLHVLTLIRRGPSRHNFRHLQCTAAGGCHSCTQSLDLREACMVSQRRDMQVAGLT